MATQPMNELTAGLAELRHENQELQAAVRAAEDQRGRDLIAKTEVSPSPARTRDRTRTRGGGDGDSLAYSGVPQPTLVPLPASQDDDKIRRQAAAKAAEGHDPKGPQDKPDEDMKPSPETTAQAVVELTESMETAVGSLHRELRCLWNATESIGALKNSCVLCIKAKDCATKTFYDTTIPRLRAAAGSDVSSSWTSSSPHSLVMLCKDGGVRQQVADRARQRSDGQAIVLFDTPPSKKQLDSVLQCGKQWLT